MTKEKIINAEVIANEILKQCRQSDDFAKLIQSKQDIIEQINQLNSRAGIYRREISDLTCSMNDLHAAIDEAIKNGDDPEALTQELRRRKTAVTDRESWIEKTEDHIKSIHSRTTEVNQHLVKCIHDALKIYRHELIAEMQAELSQITAKQAAFAQACKIISKSIPDLPGLSSTLCRITFGQNPLGVTIL